MEKPGILSDKMAQNSPQTSSMVDEEEFLPGHPDVVSFTQNCFGRLVKATQKAHGLPKPGDDFEFYSSFPDFREFCKTQGGRVLNTVGKLLKFQHVNCGWPSEIDYEHSLDTDDIFESLVEANDILLERIDTCLDEASGLSKNKKPVLPKSMQQGTPVISSWNKSGQQTNDNKVRFLHAKNILRPQLRFKEKPDNTNVPFVPIIKEKPNAMKPLEDQFSSEVTDDPNVPLALANFIHEQRMGASSSHNPHPYKFELDQFEPPSEDIKSQNETMYKPLEDTELIIVNTDEKLFQLLEVLKHVGIFAVDLEHHSFRSFQGIVCLMQVSTHEQDYLVDTLELRSELPLLNEVFTDPKILKVMHGADMDIGWLQRDFGIYVVNMFDTGQATRVLEYPRFSLAFLLKKFCNVTANKQYQLADWRIRPLPEEMVLYAREDTHYLLYIYERLCNELVAKGNEYNNLLASVYKRSKNICLKVYEKPIFTSESYLNLYKRHKKALTPNQLEAFRLLYAWRDQIARLEDESYAYVLPNHMLFGLAEVLPKEPQGVLACCNPVPSLVRQNINEIHRLIVQAREVGPVLNGPVTNVQSVSTRELSSERMDVDQVKLSNTRHKTQDASIKHKPMVPFKEYPITGPTLDLAQPMVRLFIYQETTTEFTEGEKKAQQIQDSFINPFQKFLPAKKFSEISTVSKNNEDETKPSDVAEKDSESRSNVSDDDVVEVAHRYTKATERYTKAGVDDNANVPNEHGKKRKQDDLDVNRDENEKGSALRVKKHKKKSSKKHNRGIEDAETDGQTPNTSQFEAYDYNNASLDFEKTEAGETGKDVFNPYKKLGEKGKKRNSKVHMKSGERSMTFYKKK